MGRFYSGDIEGKFWFGVQPSCDGEFFGAEEQEPSSIKYFTEDIETAKNGVKKCIDNLGEYKDKIDEFFSDKDCYNDEQLAKYLGINSLAKIKELLQWYARLELGEKIVKCLQENGSCYFEADI